MAARATRPMFDRSPDAGRIGTLLRQETVGGVLLLVAAAAALVWANSPWAATYFRLRNFSLGPESLHLNLSVGQWASDGLLALFFFVAGLELKREFRTGDLRDPRKAAVPIAAACLGMAVPAGIYLAVNSGSAPQGWAIPIATDIAFALAILAVVGTHLPAGLRTFLLTLAVVDDLLAILVIAAAFTSQLHWGWLGLAMVPLAGFAVGVRRRWPGYVLVPLAVLTWALVHASGVHATVAGVALAFVVPVRQAGGSAERFDHLLRPWSAGLAVPVFALFAAGVQVGGVRGFTDAVGSPIAIGIIGGLVIGKTAGILLGAYLAGRATGAPLSTELSWWDVVGVAVLGGVGFTVALLIGDLAFGVGTDQGAQATIGVLTGSAIAALLAAVLLRVRNSRYRRITLQELSDSGRPGVGSSDLPGEEPR